MKKIPTALERDWTTGLVTSTPNPLCDWVTAGTGEAHRKLDGACALVRNGRLWKRTTVKAGRPLRTGFTVADEDPITGKRFGWLPVSADDPADRWFREAKYGEFDLFKNRVKIPPAWEPPLYDLLAEGQAICPGTFELIGPKINGGEPDITGTSGLHLLVRHSTTECLWDADRDQPAWPYSLWDARLPDRPDAPGGTELIRWFRTFVPAHWEGVVWTHPDGRQAKLKWRDIDPET